MQDKIKILIAAVAEEERRVLRQALMPIAHARNQDADVKDARSCSEVIEAMQSGDFSCVILSDSISDTLSGGDGADCLARMRGADPTTPLVLLVSDEAGNIGDAALEKLKAGITITLPWSDLSPRLLTSCVQSAINACQSQKQIKQVQEELHLRDRAIAASSNGVVISDPHQPDCPIIYCNPAFTAITGYSRDEVIGRNCRFLQGKDTQDYYIQQVRDCLREERDCQIILRNYKKDGTPFWNELTISPVRDAEGRLTHFIGVQTDITPRRSAEDALLHNAQRQHTLLRDMFANVTEGKLRLCASEEELPPPLARFVEPIPLAVSNGVRALRQQTVKACRTVGIPAERCDDLEAAVGEAGMNAIVHSGNGTGHVFTHERGTVQVQVSDEGKGIDVEDLPNATLRRGYSTAGTMGHGFKMMLQIVDRVHLLTSGKGTTVVMEQNRVAPSPHW